jgi:hypothetical protein
VPKSLPCTRTALKEQSSFLMENCMTQHLKRRGWDAIRLDESHMQDTRRRDLDSGSRQGSGLNSDWLHSIVGKYCLHDPVDLDQIVFDHWRSRNNAVLSTENSSTFDLLSWILRVQ